VSKVVIGRIESIANFFRGSHQDSVAITIGDELSRMMSRLERETFPPMRLAITSTHFRDPNPSSHSITFTFPSASPASHTFTFRWKTDEGGEPFATSLSMSQRELKPDGITPVQVNTPQPQVSKKLGNELHLLQRRAFITHFVPSRVGELFGSDSSLGDLTSEDYSMLSDALQSFLRRPHVIRSARTVISDVLAHGADGAADAINRVLDRKYGPYTDSR
jgi:hypothetical protein